MPNGPDLPPTIDLGPAVLAPLAPDAAAGLGEAIARIDPWAHMSYPAAALIAYLQTADPAARKLAILVDGQTVGAVAIRSPWLKGPYLEFLALLPPHQGHGIGGRILRWMEAQAGDARNLWVVASDFNTRAIAFYERHGFRRTAALPGLAADGFTEILLRKRRA